MKALVLLIAVATWLGASLNTESVGLVFLLWGFACVATLYGASLMLTILALVCSVSYHYMDINTGGTLTATVLPWLFWVSLLIMLFHLLMKYPALMATHGDGGGGFFDGDVGGGD